MVNSCSINLDSKRVLVTASTEGIGFGIAKCVGKLGASVVINGRYSDKLSDAVEKLKALGIRAYGIKADLKNRGEGEKLVKGAAKILGGLDSIVYVPPPPPGGGVLSVSIRDWQVSYRLLIEAALEVVYTGLEFLKKKGGNIVFVTSIAAITPIKDIATSSVLRPGLHVLTRLLAEELGKYNIRVNSVAPGYIMTARLENIASKRAQQSGKAKEDIINEIASKVPLNKIGSPEDIGCTVAFLLSDPASYISGAIIPVSGGL
jgi:3-oxoacyl-[acyl-carrier protein] reductase